MDNQADIDLYNRRFSHKLSLDEYYDYKTRISRLSVATTESTGNRDEFDMYDKKHSPSVFLIAEGTLSEQIMLRSPRFKTNDSNEDSGVSIEKSEFPWKSTTV